MGNSLFECPKCGFSKEAQAGLNRSCPTCQVLMVEKPLVVKAPETPKVENEAKSEPAKTKVKKSVSPKKKARRGKKD